jgi:hypothetical protein
LPRNSIILGASLDRRARRRRKRREARRKPPERNRRRLSYLEESFSMT